MNKKLIALAVAGTFAGYGAVASAATVSGFANIIYTAVDDAAGPAAGSSAKNPNEGKFGADAEIDVIATSGAVTTRVDVDLNLTGGGDSGTLEQAMFAWDLGAVTLIGGVFNNPIGADAEDAPDMDFTTHSVVYNILDHQTARDGNNITGVAVAGAVGPVTLTGAFLNDIQDANEENSLAFVVNYSPIAGLDLEAGFVTQDDQMNTATPPAATTAGDVANFNVIYSIKGFTVGLDYLAPSNIIDSAYTIWGGYTHGDFNFKVRTESVAWEATGAADHDVNTLYATYAANENLSIALEFRDGDQGAATAPGNTANAITGVAQDSVATLEFIATF
ncbi:MAG TPA: hypothetical protein ENJ08_17720 [Gammaproteobacteria bacterium]|nr:hypothetical protein [Gammaproteobacteria bacterium]